MSGMDSLLALMLDDQVPAEVARIPTRALMAISAKLSDVAGERAGMMDSNHQYGYVEGRHDLVREIIEIIQREMAPAVELHKQMTGEAGG